MSLFCQGGLYNYLMVKADFQVFKDTFNRATQKAAIAAYKKIQELHVDLDQQNADLKQSLRSDGLKAVGRLLDGAAVEAMQEVFETQSDFYIEIRGSEGRKDTRRDGIASPDLYGSYGAKDGVTVEIVNDAVEGTSFASRNIPGATSILAAALDQKNGLIQTGNFDYMSKLFGPPQLRGKISLELSPEENIKIALREFNINNPRDLAVVILDRPRNSFEIESAQKLGVTTILIPGGDLMPGLLAVLDPQVLKKIKKSRIPKNIKAILLMGSGGWEEGIITAAGAKAARGHAQGRIYSEDKELIEQAKVMEISDLVPADPESILISASPITEDLWFDVAGATDSEAKTIVITHKGFEII